MLYGFHVGTQGFHTFPGFRLLEPKANQLSRLANYGGIDLVRLLGKKRAEIEKINLRLQTLLDSFWDAIIDRETYVAEKAKGMSQKKTLEEQSTALSAGRANWLEPFQSWILTARNAGGIAVSGSPQEKKVLAQKVFGSNLVLDCKKARGSCVKPWLSLLDNSSSRMVERAKGIEPSCEAWKASVLPLNYARLRCAPARQARSRFSEF